MSISMMTSKGQTTIPIDIRTYLGVHTGDKLEFFISEQGDVIVAPLTGDVTKLKGFLPKPKKKVSIEDMNKAIAKRAAKYERD